MRMCRRRKETATGRPAEEPKSEARRAAVPRVAEQPDAARQLGAQAAAVRAREAWPQAPEAVQPEAEPRRAARTRAARRPAAQAEEERPLPSWAASP
jgi:hypothetical protein